VGRKATFGAIRAAGGTMKRELAIYLHPTTKAVSGKWVHGVEPWDVRVMTRAEGYAMVRRKGAAPFVVPERDLRPVPPQGERA